MILTIQGLKQNAKERLSKLTNKKIKNCPKSVTKTAQSFLSIIWIISLCLQCTMMPRRNGCNRKSVCLLRNVHIAFGQQWIVHIKCQFIWKKVSPKINAWCACFESTFFSLLFLSNLVGIGSHSITECSNFHLHFHRGQRSQLMSLGKNRCRSLKNVQ